MAYKNDLPEELEREAETDPASAAPKLLDLVFRLLSERHAYRFTLELIANGSCNNPAQLADHAKEVCAEYVR